MMISGSLYNKSISIGIIAIMVCTCMCCPMSVHAAGAVNKESIITNVRNPSNGVITYDVTVPAGETIDYSVELTPDKKYRSPEVVNGSWKNRAKKTVKKTITVRVDHLTDRYKIKACYLAEYRGKEIIYIDEEKAMSSLRTTVFTSRLSWDFDKLGKGQKEWKYRYKYVPYMDGYKQYVEVFSKTGKKVKSYVIEIVPISKITKLIKEMKTR